MGYMQNVGRAWLDNVRQIETTTPVLGGDDGPLNYPHRDLMQRTNYLKDQIDGAKKTLDTKTRTIIAEKEPTGDFDDGTVWLEDQGVGISVDDLDDSVTRAEISSLVKSALS